MNQSERKYLIARVEKISLDFNTQLNNTKSYLSLKEATCLALKSGKVSIQKDYTNIIILELNDGYSYGNNIGTIEIEDLLDGFVEFKEKWKVEDDKHEDKIKTARKNLKKETNRLRDIMAMDQELTQETAIKYLQEFEDYVLL